MLNQLKHAGSSYVSHRVFGLIWYKSDDFGEISSSDSEMCSDVVIVVNVEGADVKQSCI